MRPIVGSVVLFVATHGVSGLRAAQDPVATRLPASFQLEPGFSIAFDTSYATILRDGIATRIPHDLFTSSEQLVRIQHTPLASDGDRRSFIEIFRWHRPPPLSVATQLTLDRQLAAPTPVWQMLWRVYEVDLDELVQLVDVTVMSTTVDPQQRKLPELQALARLDVAGNGQIRWSIGDSPSRMVRAIPSRDDRREHDRLARIDWTLQYDKTRTPSLSYIGSAGCGFLTAYAWTADHAEALWISVDERRLQISSEPQAFDLATTSTVTVRAFVFQSSRRQFPWCTDVGEPPLNDREVWIAVSGSIALSVVDHRAMVRLERAEFVGKDRRRVRLPAPVRLNAQVHNVSG